MLLSGCQGSSGGGGGDGGGDDEETPYNPPTPPSTTGAFISVWDTSRNSIGSSNVNQVKLPLASNGNYGFTVYWGDGKSDSISSYSDTAATHTYSTSGEYSLIITGTLKGFSFDNSGDRLKLIEIKQWGCLKLGDNGAYFSGCENLTISASDALDRTETKVMKNAFHGCSSIAAIPSLNGWDMSNVTDMSGMFSGATAFNQNIGNWNVYKTTDMSVMFKGAT
jgi:surface protein